jgi:hypothetical protein
MMMPLTLSDDPLVPSARELRIAEGKPLLISKLSMHPSALPFTQLASIPTKSRSGEPDKLGLKNSVKELGTLVVGLVESTSGPENEAFIVVPVKPTL